jgi:hypothetical protein
MKQKAYASVLEDNYIYISHLDEKFQFWKLPTWPDTVSDTMQSNFASTNALGRTAPVYTFSNSGPRTVQISLPLHRDIMDDVNKLTGGEINPEEIINEAIRSNIPDPTAIEQMIGKELNYDTLCEFVGEEVSIQTITNFIGDGIDPNECAAVLSEVDINAVINDLGGEITYKALEAKVGEDFTYRELMGYLEGFQGAE